MKRRIAALALAVAAFAWLGGAGASAAVGVSPTMQFPTTGWNGYAPAVVQCGQLLGANMNVTTDQAIPITVPTANYLINSIWMSNASVSLTTASGGVYTAISKGGTTIVSNAAISTLTAAAVNAAGSAMALTIATGGTTSYFNAATLYFSLTTAQGAAATADVRIYCQPLYK